MRVRNKTLKPLEGEKGYQKIMVKYYYPKTNRFGKRRREYKTRVVEDLIEELKNIC